ADALVRVVAVDQEEVEGRAAQRAACARERLRRVRVAANQVQLLSGADETTVERDLPDGIASAELALRQGDADDGRRPGERRREQEERAAPGRADLEEPLRLLHRHEPEQAADLGAHLAARKLDAVRRERVRNVDESVEVGRELAGRAEASTG